MSDEELIEDLILKGGIQPAGIDSQTGDMLYAFTPKIKELMPELYEDHISALILKLWGFGKKGI